MLFSILSLIKLIILNSNSFPQLWLKEGFARFIEYCVLLEIFTSPSPDPSSDQSSFNTRPCSQSIANFPTELLNHFQFTSSDVWGSFVLDVFWESLIADSQNSTLELSTGHFQQISAAERILQTGPSKRGWNQLQRVARRYERKDTVFHVNQAVVSSGLVTDKGFQFSQRRSYLELSKPLDPTTRNKKKTRKKEFIGDPPHPIMKPSADISTELKESRVIVFTKYLTFREYSDQ